MRNKIWPILFAAGILFILSGILFYFQLSKVPVSKNSSFPQAPQTKNIIITPIKKQIKLETVFITEVYDGDTIKTKDDKIIRYIGINSPEITDPFFKQARDKNSALVLNKTVSLELDAAQKDRYGRMLAYVHVGNTFVNLEIVKAGLAVSETIQPNIKHQDEIIAAQKSARGNCLGLWQGTCQQGTTCIKIANINYDAVGDDSANKNGEWVEIQNICSKNISMNDWLLKDNSASNEYHFKNFTLNSNSIVNLYSGCGADSQAKLYWSCPQQKYPVWNNAGDHAYLYNSGGELISDFGY